MFQKAITVTSKGTFTLPAKVRKELGITKAGDKLLLSYHEKSKTVEIRTVPNLRSIQLENARLAKNIKPLTDVNKVRAGMYTERWKRSQHETSK